MSRGGIGERVVEKLARSLVVGKVTRWKVDRLDSQYVVGLVV